MAIITAAIAEVVIQHATSHARYDATYMAGTDEDAVETHARLLKEVATVAGMATNSMLATPKGTRL